MHMVYVGFPDKQLFNVMMETVVYFFMFVVYIYNDSIILLLFFVGFIH